MIEKFLGGLITLCIGLVSALWYVHTDKIKDLKECKVDKEVFNAKYDALKESNDRIENRLNENFKTIFEKLDKMSQDVALLNGRRIND